MNRTEITQTTSSDVWYISELKYFPDGQSALFLGAGITSFHDRIIFNSHELDVSFWAVAADNSASSAILKDRRGAVEHVCTPQTSSGLTTQFPGVAHADRSSFTFCLQIDDGYSDHIFDVFIELAGRTIHFASMSLIKKQVSKLSLEHVHVVHQIEYLQNCSRKKSNSLQLAQLCTHVISICKEKTRAVIYAILGDALASENQYEDAIAAYRKAVEIHPQNPRFGTRLAALLKQHATVDTETTAIPKGIALSTSGDTALTVIVDMLHSGTPSYMFVRELFQNELDAIYRRWDMEVTKHGQSDFSGLIRIGPDAGDARKLCFWGNGIGMTFDQVTEHLAKLVNSGNAMHHAANPSEPYSPNNLGIGAKTSALPDNTEGMVYRTLAYGEANGIEFSLWKNPNTFLYEIKARKNAKKVEHYQKINSRSFITDIQQNGSGTSVTLLGKHADEKTIDKLQSLLSRQMGSELIEKGIAYFLNSRYFTLPAVGLDVQVADSDEEGLLSWIPVIGQKACLDRHAIDSGSITMKAMGLEVFAHWWILSETAAEDSGTTFNALGHVGLLWKNELYYNPNESLRIQRLQLNSFGIHQGEERVVIYIEPCDVDLVDSHSSRAQLMYKMRELNASDFGERFANNMPTELVAFQKGLAKNHISTDKIEAIKDSLSVLGVHKSAKMRQFSSALANRGKIKKQSVKYKEILEESVEEAFKPRIPGNIWREFDEETILFAAEWDSKGYLIKFNSAWPHYQKTLATLVAEASEDYSQHEQASLVERCENLLRFEYLNTVIQTLFSSYSLMEYSSWTDRMIENQLLSPGSLSAILQYNSNMRSNIKLALVSSLRDA